MSSRPVPFLRNALSHELRHHVTPVTPQPPCPQLLPQHSPAAPLTLDDLNQPLDRLGITNSAPRRTEDVEDSIASSSLSGLMRRSDRSRPGQHRGNSRSDAAGRDQRGEADAVLMESSQLEELPEYSQNLPMWQRRQKRIVAQRAGLQSNPCASGVACPGRRLQAAASKLVTGMAARTQAAVATARERSSSGDQDCAVVEAWPSRSGAGAGAGAGAESTPRGEGGANTLESALLSSGHNDVDATVGGKREWGLRRRSLRAQKRRSSSKTCGGDGEAGAAETAAAEGGKHVAGEDSESSQQEVFDAHALPPRSNLACMLHSRESALEGAGFLSCCMYAAMKMLLHISASVFTTPGYQPGATSHTEVG